MVRVRYADVKPYTTKDGSLIRELMHPSLHGNSKQSLAEATIPAGFTTFLHRHRLSEEIYYILQGEGLMRVEDDTFKVTEGDTIYIPPGAAHQIRNVGEGPLRILCCCSPPYSHQDTELL